jgi:threonine dehydrogenase-like Zn-dependent dehydrogenase
MKEEKDMTKSRQTKIAKVQKVLERPSGATVDAICKATGWQAHSARAALSGLRKAGHVIERTQGEGKNGSSVYRIVKTPEAPS